MSKYVQSLDSKILEWVNTIFMENTLASKYSNVEFEQIIKFLKDYSLLMPDDFLHSLIIQKCPVSYIEILLRVAPKIIPVKSIVIYSKFLAGVNISVPTNFMENLLLNRRFDDFIEVYKWHPESITQEIVGCYLTILLPKKVRLPRDFGINLLARGSIEKLAQVLEYYPDILNCPEYYGRVNWDQKGLMDTLFYLNISKESDCKILEYLLTEPLRGKPDV